MLVDTLLVDTGVVPATEAATRSNQVLAANSPVAPVVPPVPSSFCASTANSIGSCCSTSLTKPLTTSAVASSADMPRCRQ